MEITHWMPFVRRYCVATPFRKQCSKTKLQLWWLSRSSSQTSPKLRISFFLSEGKVVISGLSSQTNGQSSLYWLFVNHSIPVSIKLFCSSFPIRLLFLAANCQTKAHWFFFSWPESQCVPVSIRDLTEVSSGRSSGCSRRIRQTKAHGSFSSWPESQCVPVSIRDLTEVSSGRSSGCSRRICQTKAHGSFSSRPESQCVPVSIRDLTEVSSGRSSGCSRRIRQTKAHGSFSSRPESQCVPVSIRDLTEVSSGRSSGCSRRICQTKAHGSFSFAAGEPVCACFDQGFDNRCLPAGHPDARKEFARRKPMSPFLRGRRASVCLFRSGI